MQTLWGHYLTWSVFSKIHAIDTPVRVRYVVSAKTELYIYLPLTHRGWDKTDTHDFAGDIFKCIFLNENVWSLLKISQNFVPKVWINNIPALVQIMAWCRSGDKPLSELVMVSLLTHICVTWPEWVNHCSAVLQCHIVLGSIMCHSQSCAWPMITPNTCNQTLK